MIHPQQLINITISVPDDLSGGIEISKQFYIHTRAEDASGNWTDIPIDDGIREAASRVAEQVIAALNAGKIKHPTD